MEYDLLFNFFREDFEMRSEVTGNNTTVCEKYKLTNEQKVVYEWLTTQNINTKDNVLAFWSKSYSSKRIMDVVNFAKEKQRIDGNIRNMGAWIHALLKNGRAVVNDDCNINRQVTLQFIDQHKWPTLRIYEKYIRDVAMGDDLPLTLPCDDFKRSLESLYRKVINYIDYQ